MDGRKTPEWFSCIATALLALSGAAMAGQPGAVGVSVRVVHGDAAQVDVAMPAGATRLTRDKSSSSYAYAGDVDAATQHFLRQGYRVLHAAPGATTLAFDDARMHVRVQVHPVLGASDAARIVVQADPAG